MSNDSRASMIRSAASLIASHGMSGTSFSDVLADSGAPRGSIYHHFPDGKQQLAREAVSWTSERVVGYLRAEPPTTPAGVLDRFVGLWRRVVVESAGSSGCVVAGVALDTEATDDTLIETVRASFRSWAGVLAEQFEAAGVGAGRARSLALAAVAGMEGALILCRAEQSVEPLDTVAGELRRLLP